jgi:hypothetical protein
MEYPQLLVVPENKHRSQRPRTDVSILYRIIWKKKYILYNFSMWYYKRGMTPIWYGMNTDEHLSQPLPHPEEPVDELSYVPHSHQSARAVSI